VSKDPSKNKEVRVDVKIPRSGYPKVMFFNRFRVEKAEGFRVLHFGLVVESAGILDYYCCVIAESTLTQSRENLLGYLGKIGPAAAATPAIWQTAPPSKKADVADIVNMARRGDEAEVVLSVFSIWALTLASRESEQSEIEAQPLALLRCEPELQRQFIGAMYAD